MSSRASKLMASAVYGLQLDFNNVSWFLLSSRLDDFLSSYEPPEITDGSNIIMRKCITSSPETTDGNKTSKRKCITSSPETTDGNKTSKRKSSEDDGNAKRQKSSESDVAAVIPPSPECLTEGERFWMKNNNATFKRKAKSDDKLFKNQTSKDGILADPVSNVVTPTKVSNKQDSAPPKTGKQHRPSWYPIMLKKNQLSKMSCDERRFLEEYEDHCMAAMNVDEEELKAKFGAAFDLILGPDHGLMFCTEWLSSTEPSLLYFITQSNSTVFHDDGESDEEPASFSWGARATRLPDDKKSKVAIRKIMDTLGLRAMPTPNGTSQGPSWFFLTLDCPLDFPK